MLALLNWFHRSYAGWSRLTTLEGISLLFQDNPVRTCSTTDNSFGRFTSTTYSAKSNEGGFTTLLTVRDYPLEHAGSPEDRFTSWKAEYCHAMQAYQISCNLVQEHRSDGRHPRCDFLFTNGDETIYTRVSLISQGNRLIILFACGMLQDVSSKACSESFRSIRL